MTLTPGTRLGPYEITAPIGAGGMGEVFRARDTKLGREVAIKVLPAALAHDTERVGRFRREAQILATLNHPNIAAIYGLEEANGTVGLVMELVAGNDLAQRLRGGAIPFDEAIAIARQIADALEEAHEKGIVHRDLKPANVKVTPDGKVKVLDFGLAKALEADPGASSGSGDVSHSPTMSRHATEAGLILGTAAYMSPEQARGRVVDKRADIWSFGVVLFEMLTGERLFSGETVSDVLAAVLTREPNWTALPAATPPAISRLLRRCLERDPKRRLHDIADARFDLDDALVRGNTEPAGSPPVLSASRTKPSIPWLGAVALTALGVLTGGLAVRGCATPATPTVVHLATVLPMLDDLVQQASGVAISPDATRLAFWHSLGEVRGLFLRPLDKLDPTFIAGSEEGIGPLFSPDGKSVAFFSTPLGTRPGGLYRIKIEGGAPLLLAETGTSAMGGFTFTGHWTDDGQILFSGSSPVIQRVPAAGGAVTDVTVLDVARGEQRHGQPRRLPGGRGIVYVAVVAGGRQDVMVSDGSGGPGRVLVKGATTPRYASTGHLVFALEATLFAAPLDLDRLQLTAEPFPVVEGVAVAVYGNYRHAKYDLADNGTLAYLVGGALDRRGNLVLVDRQGKATLAFDEIGTYLVPRFSPDDSRVAYAAIDQKTGERDVWIGDLKRGTRTRLTVGPGAATDPVWSPDGRTVTFASTRDEGLINLFSLSADGSGTALRLNKTSERDRSLFPRAWFKDGSALLFHAIQNGGDIGIWREDADNEDLIASTFDELEPSLSPDERFVTYVSDESGRREVYIREMGGSRRRTQVSSQGGDEPVWSPRGNEIFYRQGAKMLAAPVSTRGDVALGAPSLLFEGAYDVDPFNRDATNYDAAKDAQRFIMVRRAADATRARQQINIVVNWTEELKR